MRPSELDEHVMAAMRRWPSGAATYVVRNSIQMNGGGNHSTSRVRRALRRLEAAGAVERDHETTYAVMLVWRLPRKGAA